MFLSRYLIATALLGGCLSQLSAGQALRHPDGDNVMLAVRNQSMPEELGRGRIAKILERYYVDGLGGRENWDAVESLRVVGELTLEEGALELQAFQKKPNFIKIIISNSPRSSLVLSYDGETAWQQASNAEAPVRMTEVEARRFIHSSVFGNHLLFPFQEGKTIELIDTVPIEGVICHHIRVSLDSEFQVDYYIDIRTYREVKVVNTDLQSGFETAINYEDYHVEMGVPIATSVTSFEDGKQVSMLKLNEVRFNTGVMPWMFSMPK